MDTNSDEKCGDGTAGVDEIVVFAGVDESAVGDGVVGGGVGDGVVGGGVGDGCRCWRSR